MKKILFSLSFFVFLLFFGSTVANASELPCSENLSFKETSAYEFFTTINPDYFSVATSSAQEAPIWVKNYILQNIKASNYKYVLDLVFLYNLELESKTPVPLSSAFTVWVTRLSSHRPSTADGWRVDIVVTMGQNITFNDNGTLTPHGTPTMSIEHWMGTGWSASTPNLSISSTRIENNRAVRWNASFDFVATFWEFHLPIFTRNFGRITIQHRIA